MSNHPMRLMIDTNVWLDNYCGWHEGNASCRDLLKLARRRGYELYYPVHALKDALYLIGIEYKRQVRGLTGTLTEAQATAAQETALGCIRNLMELATAVGADGSDIWLAEKYLPIHHDFEDNLVLAACKRIKADYLITKDAKLIKNADVLAKTPAQMVELMRMNRLGN